MYHFIVNPHSSSGKGLRYWRIVKDILDKEGVSYTTYTSKNEGHASELAGKICTENKGIKNIVVLGGDGTLNEVLNGLSETADVILGYIPCGSSNDLARNLRIPKNPAEALAHILKPTKFKFLDYGVIDFHNSVECPRRFIGSSGFGFDAEVCADAQASSLKRKLNRYGLGKLIYIAIALRKLIRIKFVDAVVISDGNRKTVYQKVLFISPMIHRYEGGGMMMAPEADPSDGFLSVCLIHGLSKLKILLLLPTVFSGRHISFKGVETFNCTNIDITTSHETAVHTDGEVVAVCSHITASCVSGQIRMIL